VANTTISLVYRSAIWALIAPFLSCNRTLQPINISLVFTTSQSAFRMQTLNFIFFIAVKNFKMEEFTNFDLLIFKSALENHQTLHQSDSNSIIADFLTAISTKMILTLAELTSAKNCRPGRLIGRHLGRHCRTPTSFSRAVKLYIFRRKWPTCSSSRRHRTRHNQRLYLNQYSD
jgi:hypothetical protein